MVDTRDRPVDCGPNEIPLTKGQKTLVDPDMFEPLSMRSWSAHWDKSAQAYYAKGTGSEWIHRVIMGCVKGDGLRVDHINGDSLDNRRSNLRIATASQNMANGKMSKKNTSGFRGVSWNKAAGKWQAHIRMNRKKIFLGHYATPEAASLAYANAAKEFFGEFARK